MHMSSHMARRELAARMPRKTLRILMVEDCKSDVFLLKRLLEEASMSALYDISDVPRLVEAFERIDSECFDLIMLDLNLLDIDGVASVAALRAQAPRLPIMVYSGTDDIKVKEKALMCGATHYLVKGRESGFGLKHMIERAVA